MFHRRVRNLGPSSRPTNREFNDSDLVASIERPDGSLAEEEFPPELGDHLRTAAEGDLLDQARAVDDDGDGELPRDLSADAPEADIWEQHQPATDATSEGDDRRSDNDE